MSAFRGMSLGTGVILAILGIILWAFPVLSMSVFAMLVGFGILVVGVNATYTWFGVLRGSGAGAGVLVTGILCIVFGMLCLIYPLVFAEAITWFIAVAIIVFGIAQIVSLIATPNAKGKVLGIIGNLIVILFGILACVFPTLITLYIGISLFIEGLTMIIVSMSWPKDQG